MQPHWMRVGKHIGTLAVASVLALASGGCYFSSTGSADRLVQRPDLVPAAYWPTPPVKDLDETLFAYPDTGTLAPPGTTRSPAAAAGTSTAYLRIHRTRGMIVKLNVDDMGRPAERPPDLMSLFVGFSPNGYAQTGLTFGTVSEHVKALIQERVRMAQIRARTSPQAAPTPLPFCAPTVIVEERASYSTGIAFRFPTFLPPNPRGIILHLWALGSNPYEREVISEFQRRGWIVIDIDPDDGINTDIDEASVERILELEDRRGLAVSLLNPLELKGTLDERAEARRKDPLYKVVEELSRESTRLLNPPLTLATEADIEPLAHLLAKEIDQTLGRNALAAEAIFDCFHTLHPQTATLPTVVVGFSAGALSTPAVVARLRDKVDAAVMIGGAANLVEVGARSTFYDGGITLETRPLRHGEPKSNKERPNRPPDHLVRQLGARYLELCRLDPYHTAAALRGMPVLQVHAIWDTWVPADLGDVLYERLGRPDLLTHTGGHGMLFYFLPGQASWIADWLERAVRRS